MRKTIIMAALAVFSATAFAQDDLVKDAEKLAKKGNVAEAVAMITPALTSDQTLDKAKAWNVMFTIKHNHFTELFKQKALTNSTDLDVEMYTALYDAYEAALKCDEYDTKPNEKGKVKIKYRKENATKLSFDRLNLINGGQMYYNNNDNATAIKYWKMYVDVPKTALFSELKPTADPYLHEICYFIALASYNQKDYSAAIEYSNLAAQDTARVKDANEIIIFSLKDSAKTPEDSLTYLAKVKEFHKAEPNEERYYNMLMDYYIKPGRETELFQWVNEEITANPDNKMSWYLKGYVEMNNAKYDDCIASYTKALELDPNFVEVALNLGVCYYNKAKGMQDELSDKDTGLLTNENSEKVKKVVEQAKVYVLKARELDPNREKADWAYTLYQIYYALNDEAGMAEVEKIRNN